MEVSIIPFRYRFCYSAVSSDVPSSSAETYNLVAVLFEFAI